MSLRNAFMILWLAAFSFSATAQQYNFTNTNKPPRKSAQTTTRKLTPQQQFVLDPVKMAVALPEPDPQDRLRVLASAANVVLPIDQKMAKSLWREGVRIESELIQSGQKPAVSLMSNGQTDCASAQSFVSSIRQRSEHFFKMD